MIYKYILNSNDARSLYIQRKFCRAELTSRNKTHKGFDTWLKGNYAGGQPSAVDFQTALDDEDSIVAPSSAMYATPPLPVDNPTDADGNLIHPLFSGAYICICACMF